MAKLNINDRRKARTRYKLKLAANNRPRLSIFRTPNHIHAQIIDDAQGKTVAAASTTQKTLSAGLKSTGNVEAAKKVGAAIGKLAKEKNVIQVVFDRGQYKFHGRVKALADAAREAGLEF